MLYLWLKAVHVAAVLTWVGGMLAVAVVLAVQPAVAGDAPAVDAPARQRLAHAVRRWDRTVTTPAMLLVWAMGLTLALRGRWFASGAAPAGWLPLKLVFVLALSALHGMQSGALRRLAGGGEPGPGGVARLAPRLILGAVAAIVLLVVVKPF